MKKLLPVFVGIVLCFSACGFNSGSESVVETTSMQEAVTTLTAEATEAPIPYEETMEYSESFARALYLHYLDKAFAQGVLEDYRFIDVSVIAKISPNENEFSFLAYYDVLPAGESDFNPGNGEKQADGWITGKIAEVTAVRDLLSEESMDGFAIGSQASYAGTWNKPAEALEHGIDDDKLKAEAKRLYTKSLEESINTNHFKTNYKIHKIFIEYVGDDYFDFSVNYDTLLADKNDATANGAIFKDGWVIGRYAYVTVYKVDGEYVINSEGTNMIMREFE